MKVLNLKNLKNLRQSGLVLKGNFGVTASKVLANNDVRIYRYCTTALGKV